MKLKSREPEKKRKRKEVKKVGDTNKSLRKAPNSFKTS
jgi:hypothetical protein